MKDEDLTQKIKGENHRIAGNDYTENNYIQYPDIEQWLLWASMDEQDKCCLNNENLFKRRFGFGAPKQQRRHAIAIKNKFDLTDLEVSQLKQSRLLTLAKGKPTSLCADKYVFWSSVAEIFMYTLVFGGLALLMNFKVHEPLPRFAGVFLFLGIYFLLLFMQHKTAIQPLRILRARGFKLGDTYILINPDEDNTALLEKIEGQKKQSTFLIELRE